MELASDTKSIKYSPTSTPILDGLRELPKRSWLRLAAGEYFFLSGIAILALIGLPLLRRTSESLAALGFLPSILIACLLIPAGALLLGHAVHESGHLIAAWLVGFRLQPSRSRSEDDDRSPSCGALQIAGLALKPEKMEHLPIRLLVLFAAGPTANLLIPGICETVLRMARWDGAVTLFVHAFSGVSVLQGIADLLPDSGRGNFSDGSRLLMLLKRDALAGRWFSTIELQSSLDRGEPAVAWEEARVLKLTAVTDDSRDAVAAAWLGYIWATVRQDITLATKYLEETLEAFPSATGALRGRLLFEAAVFQAWFREDPTRARYWSGRIRRNAIASLQQPRLSIALLWADGKLFDAWTKLSEYIRELAVRPASPERDRAEKHAREWKAQMESRMLTRAWRTIYSMSRQVEQAEPKGLETASW